MCQISVIVPVYKVEPYLHRCIDSILAQTFVDFELILVDDGSPDNCGAICDEYAQKDSRVHVIHQENGGLSAARNAGLDWVFSNSDSQWLTFVDSDDWVHLQYLELLYASVIRTRADISICQHVSLSKNIEEKRITSFCYEMQSPELLWSTQYGATVSACGKLFCRECWKEKRFPVGKQAEDLFVMPQIVFLQNEVCFISHALYYYFRNPESIMHSAWYPIKLTMLEAHEKQIKWFSENGYAMALKRQYYSYAMNLVMHIEGMDKANYNPNKKRELQKALQRVLLQHCREAVPFSKQNTWIYESAFPNVMRIYWYCQVLKNKLRKRQDERKDC